MSVHFVMREFECRCGCRMPTPVRARVHTLCVALERLRAELGRPVRVNSGYRCPAHNRAVGGARASQHVLGCAVDLSVAGMTGAELAARLESLIARGAIPDGGIGLYPDRPSIVHYDQRGKHVRW